MNKSNKVVLEGKLILMRPHTSSSETHKKEILLVYTEDTKIVNEEDFKEWSKDHLVGNQEYRDKNCEYGYMEFSVGNTRNSYDFMITENKH